MHCPNQNWLRDCRGFVSPSNGRKGPNSSDRNLTRSTCNNCVRAYCFSHLVREVPAICGAESSQVNNSWFRFHRGGRPGFVDGSTCSSACRLVSKLARAVIGRVRSRVPEVATDHRHVDTGSDELNSDTMTPRVRRDSLCRERWRVVRS